MPAHSFGLAIFLSQLLGVAFILLSTFAKDYHYESLTLPGGQHIEVSVSLFSVNANSACLPFWINAPFMKRSFDSFDARACRAVVAALNQRSLREVTDTLCSLSLTVFGLPPAGCVVFESLTAASNLFLLFLSLALICSLSSLGLIILFFCSLPTLLTRKAIIATQFGSVLFISIGVSFYVMLGGNMHADMFLGGLLVGESHHDFVFSFGSGIAVAMATLLWTWTLPLWSVWALKLKYCDDYDTNTIEDEEVEYLIDQTRGEIQKLKQSGITHFAQRPTASEIIRSYHQNNTLP